MRSVERLLGDGSVLVIREMQQEDVPLVAALEEQTFSQPWSEHGFRQEVGRKDRLFVVACLDGELAGYMGMLALAGEGDITNVAVESRYRRRGIACLMLKTALEWGQEMGISEFTLEVRVGNQAAISLYEGLGFQGEGVRRGFYDKPVEDGLIMWRRQ